MFFHKPLRELKTRALLRDSDRRTLKTLVFEQFSVQGPAQAAALVPDSLQMARFVASSGRPGTLYTASAAEHHQPLWFTFQSAGAETMIPTLYTLERAPHLLPTLLVSDSVLPYIKQGKDLRASGVLAPRAVLDALPNGAIVSIRNIAVGRLVIPGKDIQPDKKGTVVAVVHVVDDVIYDMGTKTYRKEDPAATNTLRARSPQVPSPPPPAAVVLMPQGKRIYPSARTLNLTSLAEVDGLLRTALLLAINSFPQAELPISTSNFYCSHIIPSRPAELVHLSSTPVDIKNSTFKSLTAFLKTAQKDGLLMIKTKSDSITTLNAGHPDIAALLREMNEKTVGITVQANDSEASEEVNRPQTKQAEYVSLFKPGGQTIALFEDAGFDTTKLYTAGEVQAMLDGYIATWQLQSADDPRYINILPNSPLQMALYLKDCPERCKKGKAAKRLQDHMEAWYSFSGSPGRGALPPVSVVVQKLQGKRKITLLAGFERYGLDPELLASELQLLCASSTSVSSLPGSASRKEVMVQGNQIKKVVEALIQRGVPMERIEAEKKEKKAPVSQPAPNRNIGGAQTAKRRAKS